MKHWKSFLVTQPIIFLLLTLLSASYSVAIQFGKSSILSVDYGKFYQSTRFIVEGKNAYTPIFYTHQSEVDGIKKIKTGRLPGNLNPPFFNLLISPLAYMNYASSWFLWSVLSIGCGLLSIFLVHKKILQYELSNKNLFMILSIVFFMYYPTFATIQFGQITLFLLPLVVGAWLAAREKRLFLTAVLLGITASIKPFFGIFFIYFLVRREWRALFLFIVVGLIGLLVSLLLLGKQTFLSYFLVLHQIKWVSSSWNASIFGFLMRLFGSTQEANVALIPMVGLIDKLYLPLYGLFCLLLIKFLLPKVTISTTQKCDLDFSVTLIVMLLLSPLGWIYYFPLLIVPFITLWQFVKNNNYPIGLFLLFILIVMLSGLPENLIATNEIKPENVVAIFFWSSLYPIALLLLLGNLFFLRTRLAQQAYPKNLTVVPNKILILLVVIALLPSFLGILKTAYNIKAHGAASLQYYRFAYFGH